MKKLFEINLLLLTCFGCTTKASDMTMPIVTKTNKIVTAWVGIYDWEDALISIKENKDLIQSVSPTWFLADTNGFLNERVESHVNDPSLRALVSEQLFLLSPLFMNANSSGAHPELISGVLRNANLRTIHATKVLSIVKDHNYSGASLDYESLSATDLGNLSLLVKELSDSLHAIGKSLTVNFECIGSSGETSWKEIGALADLVVVMAYGKRREEPSPLPNAWIRECLEMAVRNIAREKLVQGIPLYGQSWREGVVTTSTWKVFNNFLLQNPSIRLQRDQETKTPWYINDAQTVWYEDAESIQSKMEIGWSLGIKKFALWRLGGEDPALWNVIKRIAER